MKLLDIVVQDAINTELDPESRDKAIGTLLDMLVTAGSVPEDLRDEFLKAIVKRENRGSTGFGHGVAVPHIKHEKIQKMVDTSRKLVFLSANMTMDHPRLQRSHREHGFHECAGYR